MSSAKALAPKILPVTLVITSSYSDSIENTATSHFNPADTRLFPRLGRWKTKIGLEQRP